MANKVGAAQRRAAKKYQQANVLNVSVNFNKKTEPELYKYMSEYEGSRPALLRESLREHINREA